MPTSSLASKTNHAASVAVCGSLGDWIAVTKPRITLLVLLTTFAGMWLAADGMPDPLLAFVTLLGTGMAASSSSVLNNAIDHRVDALMARTRARALPSGRLTRGPVVAYGIALGGLSFALLALAVNLLTAMLALATIFFYVVIYTAWLKRTTPLCTELGGLPGAAPPLIGWAAVSGDIGLPALLLFAIMLAWQPPHFWALALVRADEYRAAGLKMLPVTHGTEATQRRMLAYTLALIPIAALPVVLGTAGAVYGVLAAVLTGVYVAKTVAFVRRPLAVEPARSLFFFSILYMTVLTLAFVVDAKAT